jgi:hypothetical protein
MLNDDNDIIDFEERNELNKRLKMPIDLGPKIRIIKLNSKTKRIQFIINVDFDPDHICQSEKEDDEITDLINELAYGYSKLGLTYLINEGLIEDKNVDGNWTVDLAIVRLPRKKRNDDNDENKN